MNKGHITMTSSDPDQESKVTEISAFSKKSCLNNKLDQSLRLEAAMVELQKEFRNKSKSISQNVDHLGQLLGINRVA